MSEWISVPDDSDFDFDLEIPELLYHGTTFDRLQQIWDSGIDLEQSRENLDFGPAFYASRSLDQALKWASRKSGVVAKCTVQIEEWQFLIRSQIVGEEWIALVTKCLTGTAENENWDVREGECCLNPIEVRSGGIPRGVGTQTALGSRRAVRAIVVEDEFFQARNDR